jgi:hypothetical protein
MKPYCYGRNIGIQRVGVKKNANDLLYALRSVLFAISPRRVSETMTQPADQLHYTVRG